MMVVSFYKGQYRQVLARSLLSKNFQSQTQLGDYFQGHHLDAPSSGITLGSKLTKSKFTSISYFKNANV